MNKSGQSKLLESQKSEFSFNALAICLVIIIVLIVALILLGTPWPHYDNARIVLVSVVGTIMSLVIAFCLWDVTFKKRFAQDVLDIAQISSNHIDSGIEYVYEKFTQINNADWKDLIQGTTKEITLVFTYARSWRKGCQDYLRAFVDSGGMLNVYLPNYTRSDQLIIRALANRFSCSETDIKNKISEAHVEYTKIGAKVKLYNDSFQNSYYLFDNVAIMSWFNHDIEEPGYVPAIRVSKRGTLYKFISEDIAAIDRFSEEYSLEKE